VSGFLFLLFMFGGSVPVGAEYLIGILHGIQPHLHSTWWLHVRFCSKTACARWLRTSSTIGDTRSRVFSNIDASRNLVFAYNIHILPEIQVTSRPPATDGEEYLLFLIAVASLCTHTKFCTKHTILYTDINRKIFICSLIITYCY
jgi:hypothetical protein